MAILYAENNAWKPFDGCPIRINEIDYKVMSSKGTFDLQVFIGKYVRNIEVNGVRKTFTPELLIQKSTKLRVKTLMNGTLEFNDESPVVID